MRKKADELLKIWYNKANTMEKLHREAYQFYSSKDAQITIPTIVISSIAGSISFLSLGFKNPIYFSIISGSLNIVSTIMSSTKEYFAWNNKFFQHNNAANSYLKIKNLIEIQLSLHKLGLNVSYEKMIPEIGSLINKVDNDAPPLPIHIAAKIPPSESNSMELLAGTDTDEREDINQTDTDSKKNKNNDLTQSDSNSFHSFNSQLSSRDDTNIVEEFNNNTDSKV
jgi:hypothetical protein